MSVLNWVRLGPLIAQNDHVSLSVLNWVRLGPLIAQNDPVSLSLRLL